MFSFQKREIGEFLSLRLASEGNSPTLRKLIHCSRPKVNNPPTTDQVKSPHRDNSLIALARIHELKMGSTFKGQGQGWRTEPHTPSNLPTNTPPPPPAPGISERDWTTRTLDYLWNICLPRYSSLSPFSLKEQTQSCS